MGKNKILKLLLILLIALFVIQLIPSINSNDDGFQAQIGGSSTIAALSVGADMIYIGRDSLKIQALKAPSKSVLVGFQDVMTCSDPIKKYFLIREPVDSRSTIRQSIPHYFYGSKFKNLSSI